MPDYAEHMEDFVEATESSIGMKHSRSNGKDLRKLLNNHPLEGWDRTCSVLALSVYVLDPAKVKPGDFEMFVSWGNGYIWIVSLQQQRISRIKFQDIRHVLYEPEDLRLTLSIAFVNKPVVIQGRTCAPAGSLAQLASTLMGVVLGEQAAQDLERLNPQRLSNALIVAGLRLQAVFMRYADSSGGALQPTPVTFGPNFVEIHWVSAPSGQQHSAPPAVEPDTTLTGESLARSIAKGGQRFYKGIEGSVEISANGRLRYQLTCDAWHFIVREYGSTAGAGLSASLDIKQQITTALQDMSWLINGPKFTVAKEGLISIAEDGIPPLHEHMQVYEAHLEEPSPSAHQDSLPTDFIDDLKICPDCAEEIKFAARKCRYCGYEFESSP